MGWAEDQFHKYLMNNMKSLEVINLTEILQYLPCLSTQNQETLRRRIILEGNEATMWDFINDLRKRDDWVNQFLQAIRLRDLGSLADRLQEVYNSFLLPRQPGNPRPLPPPGVPQASSLYYSSQSSPQQPQQNPTNIQPLQPVSILPNALNSEMFQSPVPVQSQPFSSLPSEGLPGASIQPNQVDVQSFSSLPTLAAPETPLSKPLNKVQPQLSPLLSQGVLDTLSSNNVQPQPLSSPHRLPESLSLVQPNNPLVQETGPALLPLESKSNLPLSKMETTPEPSIQSFSLTKRDNKVLQASTSNQENVPVNEIFPLQDTDQKSINNTLIKVAENPHKTLPNFQNTHLEHSKDSSQQSDTPTPLPDLGATNMQPPLINHPNPNTIASSSSSSSSSQITLPAHSSHTAQSSPAQMTKSKHITASTHPSSSPIKFTESIQAKDQITSASPTHTKPINPVTRTNASTSTYSPSTPITRADHGTGSSARHNTEVQQVNPLGSQAAASSSVCPMQEKIEDEDENILSKPGVLLSSAEANIRIGGDINGCSALSRNDELMISESLSENNHDNQTRPPVLPEQRPGTRLDRVRDTNVPTRGGTRSRDQTSPKQQASSNTPKRATESSQGSTTTEYHDSPEENEYLLNNSPRHNEYFRVLSSSVPAQEPEESSFDEDTGSFTVNVTGEANIDLGEGNDRLKSQQSSNNLQLSSNKQHIGKDEKESKHYETQTDNNYTKHLLILSIFVAAIGIWVWKKKN
ncbi:mitochondrial antiviral-signaling protein [Pelobates fuscus]|uniref:mitochondrial antiviral-signaling protein n=1 Tax=Pelobates fuscus TaxID=191477 RepID=UPI002FE4B6F9